MMKRSSIMALAVVLGLSLAGVCQAAETGTISGRVLDKEGNPAKGATVKAISPNRVPPGKRAAGGPPALATATAGDDGTFTMTDVPSGNVRVVANSGASTGIVAEVTVKTGANSAVGDIRLK